jgi:hypothetical protein
LHPLRLGGRRLRLGCFGGAFIVQFFGIVAHGLLLMNG